MRGKYNEILRLKKMLEDAGIPFRFREQDNGGHLSSLDFTEEEIDKGWSVIEHDGSYGREQDLLEIAGEILTKGDAAIDDVRGYVSAEEVFGRIAEFEKLTMNYNPNLVNCGRMARQTIRLTFGMWDYRAEKETTVGGNCLGLEVIETAVENVYDRLPEDSHGYEVKEIILKNNAGDELICRDDEDRADDWLKEMLVKAEIVAIEEDKKC